MLNRLASDGHQIELDWVVAGGLDGEPWAIWEMDGYWFVAMNGDMLSVIHTGLRRYVMDNPTVSRMVEAMVVDLVDSFIAAKVSS